MLTPSNNIVNSSKNSIVPSSRLFGLFFVGLCFALSIAWTPWHRANANNLDSSYDTQNINFLSIGFQAGFVITDEHSIVPGATQRQSDRRGYFLGIQPQIRLFRGNFIYAAALAWNYIRITGDHQSNSNIAPKSLQTDTRSASFSLSQQYRFREWLHFGPTILSLHGIDTGFGPERNKQFLNIFAGLTLSYYPDRPRTRNRFAHQADMIAFRSLNLKKRDVTLIGTRISLARLAGPRLVAQVKPKREFSILATAIHFSTDKNHLSDQSINRLRHLAEYLQKNPESWDHLEVHGHADYRGPYRYNSELSSGRMETVYNQLLKIGIAKNRITSRFHSESIPVDPEVDHLQSLLRDRRVELVLVGVGNSSKIKHDIDEMHSIYGIGW